MMEVEARGIRFNVCRLGGGPRTVVFVHGLIMDDLSSWYFTFASQIAKIASVVLYDLRGHGKSDRPPEGYRVEDMVEDLRALLDALGLSGEQIDLVANSYGGLVAVAFAIREPKQVRSLVLLEAHLPDEGWAERMQNTLTLQGEDRDHMIAESFKDWAGRRSRARSTRLTDKALALLEGTTLLCDIKESRIYSDVDLSRVNCPTLALYGEESDLRKLGERIAQTLPRCRLELFPNCTHSIMWEQTVAVRERLVDWFSPVDPASREPKQERRTDL